jgi:hypothetical protein
MPPGPGRSTEATQMLSPVQQWLINGNGDLGILNITAVDGQGNLTATAYGQRVVGLWDPDAQRIAFARLIDPSDPSSWQTYTGYLIDTDPPVLAGSFDALSHGGGAASRATYGWVAEGRDQPGPLDLVWPSVDENGLPRNPRWWWQLEHPGQLPDPRQLCQNFSAWRNSANTNKPVVDPCTTQRPMLMSWPWHCGAGHLNWMNATYEGFLNWKEKSPTWPTGDDDYNFQLQFPFNQPLGLTSSQPDLESGHFMVVEFDSDETIDHFDRGWWQTFHDAVDNDGRKAHRMVNGVYSILTGTFGLDNEYASWTELHPVFAIAIRVSDAETRTIPAGNPNHEMWAIFVRNSGDQGGCGGDQVVMDLSANQDRGPASFSFCLPWQSRFTNAVVRQETQMFTNNTTQSWSVNILRDYGVIVTFQLARIDLDSPPFIFGELHLEWS